MARPTSLRQQNLVTPGLPIGRRNVAESTNSSQAYDVSCGRGFSYIMQKLRVQLSSSSVRPGTILRSYIFLMFHSECGFVIWVLYPQIILESVEYRGYLHKYNWHTFLFFFLSRT